MQKALRQRVASFPRWGPLLLSSPRRQPQATGTFVLVQGRPWRERQALLKHFPQPWVWSGGRLRPPCAGPVSLGD